MKCRIKAQEKDEYSMGRSDKYGDESLYRIFAYPIRDDLTKGGDHHFSRVGGLHRARQSRRVLRHFLPFGRFQIALFCHGIAEVFL